MKSSIIYKYKALNNIIDVNRLIDTLLFKKIYMPTVNQLNDVFECPNIYITYSVAGFSLSQANEENHPITNSYTSNFRVLSFSKIGNSPVMWAHYSGVFRGVCFAFRTSGSFKDNYDIEYVENHIQVIDGEEHNIDFEIEKALRKKYRLWEYEQETRIIVKTVEDQLYFENDDLIALIIGHKVLNEKRLLNHINRIMQIARIMNIPLLVTHVSHTTGKIKFIKLEEYGVYDGSEPRFVDIEDFL